MWNWLTDDSGVPLALSGDERGQVGTIIAVVTVAIVAIIGTLIFSQVLSSIGDPSTTDAVNRTQLENSTVQVTEGYGSAMQLIPVVLIVLVASLVIAVVQRFG
jgi:Flp pilus assembly pilin Flp